MYRNMLAVNKLKLLGKSSLLLIITKKKKDWSHIRKCKNITKPDSFKNSVFYYLTYSTLKGLPSTLTVIKIYIKCDFSCGIYISCIHIIDIERP